MGGPPLEFINIQPKKEGPPLEFINQKGGPPLDFINLQSPKGGPPLEFINLKMGGPPLGTISMDLAVCLYFISDRLACRENWQYALTMHVPKGDTAL
jgi:hypothetical protein